MKKANLVAGIVLLIFSVALLFWLIPWQVEEAFEGQVSPQLLPQICAIGIGVLSVVLIVGNHTAFTEPGAEDEPPAHTWTELRALVVIGGMLEVRLPRQVQ